MKNEKLFEVILAPADMLKKAMERFKKYIHLFFICRRLWNVRCRLL